MRLTEYRPIEQKAAFTNVTAHAADDLYRMNEKCDWPVSADESVRAFGYLGRRTGMVPLWSQPGLDYERVDYCSCSPRFTVWDGEFCRHCGREWGYDS